MYYVFINIWKHLPKTLKAKSPFQTSERSLNDWIEPKWICPSRVGKKGGLNCILLPVFGSFYFLFCHIFNINYPYLAKMFHFFCCNIEIAEKIRWPFLLLGVTKITLVFRYMKSNNFYCAQTANIVNSKDASC